jgi:sterol desaturase/sphingolipid hydroxylase (fatty acid hydroxylase superfamily)
MDQMFRDPVFLAAAMGLIALEWIWRRHGENRLYDGAAARASLGVGLGRAASAVLSLAIIAPVYAALWRAAPVKLPVDDWRVWLAGFIVVEFAYYWMHRTSHRVRWMWASHAVHHSAEELTLPAAFRLGWTEAFSGAWLFFAPLVLVGFNPLLVVAILAANLKFQFFLHTDSIGRLGPLEGIINTPSSHRVHHAANEPYVDKNFGGVTLLFDRLFGTYQPERDDTPVRYGLASPLGTNNVLVIVFHAWAAMAVDAMRARSPRQLAAALFGRP